MRSLTSFALLSLLSLAACAAEPSPQANGFNVELWFETPGNLTVGTPSDVKVARIQLEYSHCAGAETQCEPRSSMALVLVSAACDDDACTTEVVPSPDGSIVLATTGHRTGSATLRVKAQSADGQLFEDSYPLTFRAADGRVKQLPSN